jgi:hypothetical protein
LWAWQWADAFALERGGIPGDDGPWAGCGDNPPEYVGDIFYYDDYGLDDDFG